MLDILSQSAGAGEANWLQILILLTALAIVPTVLIMTTSFTRIIVVLSFIRTATGTQSMPPNQVLIGIALFMTLFIMGPAIQSANVEGIQPFLREEITQEEALSNVEKPLREFMLRQTRTKDIALFISMAKMERPQTVDDIPTTVLIPAFIISELRIAFQIGFLIFIPFLLIDIVIASILMSMGMMMVPPVMISLPFKLLLFVMIDGWYLLTNSLVTSFN